MFCTTEISKLPSYMLIPSPAEQATSMLSEYKITDCPVTPESINHWHVKSLKNIDVFISYVCVLIHFKEESIFYCFKVVFRFIYY